MADPVDQHTLSKFYIAGFGDSSEKRSKNPNVWYYPLDVPPPRAWRREKAKQISVRPDYYTRHTAKADERYGVEKALGMTEDWAAEPIRDLCARRGTPTAEDIHAIAVFMTSTKGRTPALVDALGDFHVRTLNLVVRRMYQRVKADPAEHSRVLADMQAQGFPTAGLEDPEAFNPDGRTLSPVPAEHARALVKQEFDLAPRLIGMRWYVMHTTVDAPFITSDAPFHLDTRQDVEITFPLSRTAALFLLDDPVATNSRTETVLEHCRAIPAVVRILNARTAMAARTFLLSSSRTFPGDADILKILDIAP